MHITTEAVKTPEDFRLVSEFAATFDHKPCGRYPVLFLRDGTTAIGYAEIVSTPLILTGFKPGYPRACVEAIRKLKAWQECQHGEGLTAISKDSPLYAHMDRLGFMSTGSALFRSK